MIFLNDFELHGFLLIPNVAANGAATEGLFFGENGVVKRTLGSMAFVNTGSYYSATQTDNRYIQSVGLSLPNIFNVITDTVNPVSGTLTATLSSQTAGYILAAPKNFNGTPSFQSPGDVGIATQVWVTSQGYLSASGYTIPSLQQVTDVDEHTTGYIVADNGFYTLNSAAGFNTTGTDLRLRSGGEDDRVILFDNGDFAVNNLSGDGDRLVVATSLGILKTKIIPEFIPKEIPIGNINGLNTLFILNYEPTVGTEHVYVNGLLQEEGVDYTISGSTITFAVGATPETGDRIRVTYYKN